MMPAALQRLIENLDAALTAPPQRRAQGVIAAYEETATAPTPLRTVRRDTGTSSFDSALGGIHRIVNNSGDIAISLHVYGVGKARVATGVNRILG
jgi:hypothetical protein